MISSETEFEVQTISSKHKLYNAVVSGGCSLAGLGWVTQKVWNFLLLHGEVI